VVAGSVLRVWALGSHRLGFDEAFTALADRRPLGDLLHYLRTQDSHPPLDYLLRLPLARAGASEWMLRTPSVLCSVGALALFAWWMRGRGPAGVVATGLLAAGAFQLEHGRDARMYAELELIGVAAACLTDAWLRRPRRWHATALGALVGVGLLTHVSTFLLVAGLMFAPGLRTDRDAWRWRCGLVLGVAVWALSWGPSFLVQSRGHHSSWIPPTTLPHLVEAIGRLMTPEPGLHLVLLVAVLAGTALILRTDRRLGRVFASCVVLPIALAAVTGLAAPVWLDRTLTLFSWGPLLALGFLVAEITRHSRPLGVCAVLILAWVTVRPGIDEVAAPSSADVAVRHLEQVARNGDVVASDPGRRLGLLVWSLGVRRDINTRPVSIRDSPEIGGVLLGDGPATDRVWLLTSVRRRARRAQPHRCAHDWSVDGLHLSCLRARITSGTPRPSVTIPLTVVRRVAGATP
jgi:uncharacterized membrane protein